MVKRSQSGSEVSLRGNQGATGVIATGDQDKQCDRTRKGVGMHAAETDAASRSGNTAAAGAIIGAGS